MNGDEVARRNREEPYGRDMLLLALSGYDAPGDSGSPSYGFDHHLVKPVDSDNLARLIGEGAEAS